LISLTLRDVCNLTGQLQQVMPSRFAQPPAQIRLQFLPDGLGTLQLVPSFASQEEDAPAAILALGGA
jgi:hypothetical protein